MGNILIGILIVTGLLGTGAMAALMTGESLNSGFHPMGNGMQDCPMEGNEGMHDDHMSGHENCEEEHDDSGHAQSGHIENEEE